MCLRGSAGVRVITSKYNLKYIQFESGFEAYDISGSITGTPDPYELYNIYSQLPTTLSAKLQKTLDDLKLCKGNGGIGGGVTTPTSVSCIVANDPVLGNGPPPPPSPPLTWPPSPPAIYLPGPPGGVVYAPSANSGANNKNVVSSRLLATSMLLVVATQLRTTGAVS